MKPIFSLPSFKNEMGVYEIKIISVSLSLRLR
jgi:hypothetical protein